MLFRAVIASAARQSPNLSSSRSATIYGAHIDEGFALLTDADLSRLLPTVFVEAGEPILTLLLGNLEHLINHKHQLFTYFEANGCRRVQP